MDVKALEDWLWRAACSIRGPIDAPKFKDYILPLIFLKRLSDVYADECKLLSEEFGDEDTTKNLIKEDHSLVRFYIPEEAIWKEIRKLSDNIGQRLTDSIRLVTKHNKSLEGVLDLVDYNASVSGKRIVDDGRLSSLIEILSDRRYNLGLNDVEPDILGRAYEYLLRKFAEGQGQSAGEFFTPKEVGWLMAYLLGLKNGESVYDPACGSGGLLIKCELSLQIPNKRKGKNLYLFGQEINHFTYAISKMNIIIHDLEGNIALEDSLKNPRFLVGSSIRSFDAVTANPMWNQKGYTADFYESDPYDRFFANPPNNTADWGWIQHMYASLKDDGRMAIVIDTGAMSRGSGKQGSDKEREIRKRFVELDVIEAIIRLPENLFYNTPAPGNIIIINNNKKKKNEVILINASKKFVNQKPKNRLTDEGTDEILHAFRSWKEIKGFSKIIRKDEIILSDYNLSPSKYVHLESNEEYADIGECIIELAQLQEEQKDIDTELDSYIKKLGYNGYMNGKNEK